MSLTIRSFEDRDRAAAADFFEELNRHEHGISNDRKTDRETAELCVAEMLRDAGQGSVIRAADVAGKLAGLMVWAAAVDQPFVEERVKNYGRVEDIVVAAAFRGQGIGQALLAEAERLTRGAGMKRLRLTVLAGNEPAAKAYARFGFHDHAVVMIKDLD